MNSLKTLNYPNFVHAIVPQRTSWTRLRSRNQCSSKWSANKNERLQLEALWVTWGAGRLHQPLMKKLLKSSDYRIRAAAMNVLRFISVASLMERNYLPKQQTTAMNEYA